MSEINSFSDRDCGRIADVVRRVESKVTVPFEKRPPPVADDGIGFFLFTLTTGWTSNRAYADLSDMDDNSLGINREIRDPLGTFASLGIGNRGNCFLQNGKYYTIQAPCP